MCIFCKIATGEISSYKIYEDDFCVAFLDLSQSNVGHTLIVPKQHFENILNLDIKTAEHLFGVTTKLTKALSKAFGYENFNILNNCGNVAGQTVMHFHIHIIPRINEDNIKIELSSNKLSSEEFEDTLNKIKEAL